MSSVPSSSPSVLSPSSADVPSPSRHSRCIVVSHLAPVLTLAHLEDLFNTIGPIQTLQWHSTPPPLSERVCLVEFVHEKHAQLAPLITDTVIGDKAIQIQPLTTFNKPSPPPSTTTPAPSTASAPPPTSASPPSTSSPLPSPHSTAPPVTGAPLVPYNFLHPPPALPLATPFPPSLPFPLDPTFTSSTIYVGNLSPVVTDAVLAEYFTQLGPLVGVQLQADTIGPNRFAFVEFQDPRAAHMALALHGQFLLGRPMKVGKANVGVGKGLLTEGERQQRAVGLGAAAGAADKVAEALAKVAAAQLSIANKLGVKVQTPAISTMAPTLTAGLPPTAAPPVMVEGGDKEKEGTGEERKERGRGRSSRSRSRSGSRSRGRSSRSRRSYSSSSRSRSPSHSPSRSVSRSRSGSRSPRSRRHRSRRDHRRHHRDRSRERSHRSSRHRRSSSRSLSPHAEGPRNAEKKEGGEGPVGADRWRAEDSEDAAMETKEAGAREKERSRDRERSKGRSSHRRHGEYSEGHRHSSSHSRRRKSEWSDDGEDADRHVYTGVGRGGGFRGRRKNGADPHAGMVWDGFSWRAKELPSADPNIGRTS